VEHFFQFGNEKQIVHRVPSRDGLGGQRIHHLIWRDIETLGGDIFESLHDRMAMVIGGLGFVYDFWFAGIATS
jgi:hypothetical protein